MNVIVTGATSFIGKAVLRELEKRGVGVYAVVRPQSPSAGELKGRAGVTLLPFDLSEIGRLTASDLTRGPAQFWLHLGWQGPGSANRRDSRLQEQNVGFALSALETAAALGCGRFLFSGSQAEYGIAEGPMREDMECRPVSEYGKNKLKVCRRALDRAGQLGIQYIHTRIFSVYGPGDHPWSLVETCLDAFLGDRDMELGACTQLWNYMYITDAARALVHLLLGNLPGGVYNVAGEDTRPLREYIEEIHRLCQGKGRCIYGVRPPNAEGTPSLVPDLTRLKAAGFQCQVDFDQGIRQMIQIRMGDQKRSVDR